MTAIVIIQFILNAALIAAVCFLFARQRRFEAKVTQFANGLGKGDSLFTRLSVAAALLFALVAIKKSGGNPNA